MDDITATIDNYIDMWNEDDADARRRLIDKTWSEPATYVDPLLEAAGVDGLVTMVDGVHQQFPGLRFRRTTAVDAHHDTVRFGWELGGADGVTVAGIDVGRLSDDGRLRSITGFFGELTT